MYTSPPQHATPAGRDTASADQGEEIDSIVRKAHDEDGARRGY